MKLNAFLLALSAALLPTVVCSPAPLEPLFTEAPTPAKTVIYQLTDKLEVGGEYLIVNINTAGNGYALSHNKEKIASGGVKIHAKDGDLPFPLRMYIFQQMTWGQARYGQQQSQETI